MNRLIILIALILFSLCVFAQPAKFDTVKRIVITNKIITNSLTDFVIPKIQKDTKIPFREQMQGCRLSAIMVYSLFVNRSITSMINTSPGIVSFDGNVPNIKGARPEGTAYFIDGVRVYYLSETPMDYAGIIVKSAFGF